MKICPRCQLNKTTDQYCKTTKNKDGLRSICRQCDAAAKKQYYIENRSRIIEQHKQYVEANKTQILIRNKGYRDRVFTAKYIDNMFRRAKARAKAKGIEFSLPSASCIIIPEYCPILNIRLEPVRGQSGGKVSSPSLDRIDCTKGYTLDNIQVISNLANTMKNCATKEQLIAFAQWVLRELTDHCESDTIRVIINTAKGDQ